MDEKTKKKEEPKVVVFGNEVGEESENNDAAKANIFISTATIITEV